MIDDMIKQAKQIIVDRRIKMMPSAHFGDMYCIDEEHNVRILTLNGRTEIHCDCPHGTRFCNSPVLCKHKIAALLAKAMIL